MKRRGQEPHGRMRELLRRRPLLVAGIVLLAVLTPAAASSLRWQVGPTTVQRAGGPGRFAQGDPESVTKPRAATAERGKLPKRAVLSNPNELRLQKARSKVFDVRSLKSVVIRRERPERRAPGEAGETETADPNAALPAAIRPNTSAPSAPAPAPDISFAGLDFATWGAGHPPDTNGDVGPTYYVQTINTSIGIYDKSNGTRVAAFTFDAFMSQGSFGNLCDTDNFGDPVVLYDSFEDRWVITDFAFQLDGSGNVSPQHVFECFAVSKSGDPVTGGWNFYSIETPGGLGDYPKLGVWPDGIYMSANMFGYSASASYTGFHVWAINKQQMYAGEPSVQVVDFAGPSSDFTLLPANARLQTGTPPAGEPEFFVSTEQFLNGLSIYKLKVDWDKVSTSTFTGPETQLAPTCWPNASVPNASTPANSADTLSVRAMVQAQYSNVGGAESLWVAHTVRRGESATNTNCNAATTGNATVRWYQANVTGGTVATDVVQGKSYDPEGANTFFRFMPSVAVDRMGNMAVGYTKSNSTTNPQLKYAGRLAGDPANTFSQTEQTLIDGTGAQSGNCGASACTRWGDYSGMALDPDGCELWETGEYYAVTGLDHQTRIGSFKFPGCTTVGSGTLSGTVTTSGSPVAGATVTLGSRTATTNGSGVYSFTVPAGTYASLAVNKAGLDPASASSITVPDGGTTTRNFALTAASQSGCFADNTQTAFQRGVPTTCDLVATPGSVVLARPDNTDAKNDSVTPTGFSFNSTTWAGQTFTPTVTGKLVRADIELFCSGCGGTNPDITVSVRATTGATPVPTGADLATATLPGFDDGAAGGLKTVTFGVPATLTAGTRYALVVRSVTNRTTGVYAYTCSCITAGFVNSNPYANGQRVTSADTGGTWTADTTVGGRDLNFVTYINPGYASSGTLVSSVKDANPGAGHTAHWTTLSFTATKPAGTDVKFQVAASNSSFGPFTFVGPDGTAATFFTTSGQTLSQFNALRYLRYKAYLSSSDSSVTPTLSAVTVCFNDNAGTNVTGLAVNSANGTYGGATSVSATLTTGVTGVGGVTIGFTVNGTSVGSAQTNASGVATLSNVSLAGINAGLYPTGIGASFAGDGSNDPSAGSGSLTIAKANQTLAVGEVGAKTFGDPDFTLSGTASSGLAVSFAVSGSCTVSVATVHINGAGSCVIAASQAGDANYNAVGGLTFTVVINKAIQTLTFAPLAAKTFGDADFTVSGSSSSGLGVVFSATGSCTSSGATVHITAAGLCTVTASQPGDANYQFAAQVTQTVAIAKAAQTITFGALANKTFGAADFTVSATASSGLAVSFAASGSCTVSGSTVHLTGAGSCTITAAQAGNANVNAATSVAQSFTILSAQPPPKKCTVPNVVGKTLAAAKLALKAKHCAAGSVSRAYSKTKKKGRVIAQSRRVGRVLPAGTKVKLVVSRGRRQ